MSFLPNSSLSTSIAAELRAEMARKRRTQADLGEVLGISQAGVSARLRGVTPIGLDELDTACKWLGVSVQTLIERARSVA